MTMETLWFFDKAMEHGPFIDDLWSFASKKGMESLESIVIMIIYL